MRLPSTAIIKRKVKGSEGGIKKTGKGRWEGREDGRKERRKRGGDNREEDRRMKKGSK